MTTDTTGKRTMFTPLWTPLGIVRQPTADECDLVGRDTIYSEPYEGINCDWTDLGDYVIQTIDADNGDGVEALRDACLELAIGDDAHIIPAGIYIEE